ncbi:MAG: tyrosine-type recombinase/integrase [Hafnia sp.]|uniref:tyrosine-type recombinase/integrase n=1 Tax=Citrobacter sp. TaxID=1896336 RepID=UPI002FC8C626
MNEINNSPRLLQHIEDYLRHWRTLGRRYRQEEWLLRVVLRDLQALGYDELTFSTYTLWFESRSNRHPNSRRKWAQILRHFCIFRRRWDPECFLPGTEQVCNKRPYVTPVIVNGKDIVLLLQAADALKPGRRSPLRAAMMRIAIVLLYTTGIRLGELQRLLLSDIETEDNGTLLRIRESKFQKTRLVPLSATTQEELKNFLLFRASAGFSIAASSALLAAHPIKTEGYSIPGLQAGIMLLFRSVFNTDTGYSRCPRIHDLRHSFAIQVLTQAYNRGEDVQVLLPKLSMYMGHVSIESTTYYLQWREEIGEFASKRFASLYADVISRR